MPSAISYLISELVPPLLPFPSLCHNFYFYFNSQYFPSFLQENSIIMPFFKSPWKCHSEYAFKTFWVLEGVWILSLKASFFRFCHLNVGWPASQIINPPTTVLEWNDLLNITFIKIVTSTLTRSFYIISACKFNYDTIFEITMKRAFRICLLKNILSLWRGLNI